MLHPINSYFPILRLFFKILLKVEQSLGQVIEGRFYFFTLNFTFLLNFLAQADYTFFRELYYFLHFFLMNPLSFLYPGLQLLPKTSYFFIFLVCLQGHASQRFFQKAIQPLQMLSGIDYLQVFFSLPLLEFEFQMMQLTVCLFFFPLFIDYGLSPHLLQFFTNRMQKFIRHYLNYCIIASVQFQLWLMAGQFFYTLMILPNLAQYLLKFFLKYFYGYQLQLLIVGILIYTINAFVISYLLHKWFVKGEGTIRQTVKGKLKTALETLERCANYMKPGNEVNLIKLYFAIVSGSIIYQLVPGIILTFAFTLFVDFYNEVTTYLQNQHSLFIYSTKESIKKKIIYFLQNLPKYKPEQKHQSQ